VRATRGPPTWLRHRRGRPTTSRPSDHDLVASSNDSRAHLIFAIVTIGLGDVDTSTAARFRGLAVRSRGTIYGRTVCWRYVSTVTPRKGAETPNRRRKGLEAWSDERIRDELHRFLADRFEWPTYREFQRNGFRQLRDAVTRAGGAERWARELGVRL